MIDAPAVPAAGVGLCAPIARARGAIPPGERGHDLLIMAPLCSCRAVADPGYRSSASRPAEAGTAGVTATRNPVRIQPR